MSAAAARFDAARIRAENASERLMPPDIDARIEIVDQMRDGAADIRKLTRERERLMQETFDNDVLLGEAQKHFAALTARLQDMGS